MREKLFKLSWVSAIISAVSFAVNYFFFHFVTDAGISLTWRPEPGKPFVANFIGVFATMWFFAATFSLVLALLFTEKNRKEDNENE